MADPCVHGDVCRAYMEKFSTFRVVPDPWILGHFRQEVVRTCILSDDCPNGCKFYKSMNSSKLIT